MNSKKIIIYQHDILFNILNEISEILNFDVIKINQIDNEEFKKDLEADTLVITKSQNNNFKNRLVVKEGPIKLEKLIELINLEFLREKFNYQSDLSIGPYKLNLNSREIEKKGKVVNLTEREINLILFLKKSRSAVKINDLQKNVWQYGPELDTHTVETHIYRLRKKLKKEFNDENFIISSKQGYLINEKK